MTDDAPIEEDLWDTIASPIELNALPMQDRGHGVRRVFSAKEAIYKALSPRVGHVFGFDAVSLRLSESGDGRGSFRAHLDRDLGPWVTGAALQGQFGAVDGRLVSILQLEVAK